MFREYLVDFMLEGLSNVLRTQVCCCPVLEHWRGLSLALFVRGRAVPQGCQVNHQHIWLTLLCHLWVNSQCSEELEAFSELLGLFTSCAALFISIQAGWAFLSRGLLELSLLQCTRLFSKASNDHFSPTNRESFVNVQQPSDVTNTWCL